MILKAKKLITGDGVTVINDAALALDGDRIVMVGKAEDVVKAYPNDKVVDYGDATITPGLTDMHVHVGNLQSKADTSAYGIELKTLMSAWELHMGLTKGITMIRDVASGRGLCRALKNARTLGYVTMPRLVSTSGGICMTGGHGWPLDDCIEADSPWDIRKEIRVNIRDEADWIKILTSHRTFTPELTQEELDAAVDEAHRLGKKICVHAGTHPSIGMCIKAGFDTIEHGSFMTVEQAKEMKEKGLAWVPTILPYTQIYLDLLDKLEKMGVDGRRITRENSDAYLRELRETRPDLDLSFFSLDVLETLYYFGDCAAAYKNNFRKLADTGVTVLAGTDMVTSNEPMTLIAKELKLMVDYGFTTLEAVKAATSSPAKVLDRADKYGTLAEGMYGDIAVFKGDVEADITALEECLATYIDGKALFEA